MATPFTLKAIAISASCLLMSGSALAEAVAKYRVSVADLAVSDSVSAKNRKCVLESSLISNIENAIRNGRKFELLTRRADALAEIRKEQEFAKSGLTAADAAAEGQLSNAQSVIKVTVESFNFGRSASKVPNLEGKSDSGHHEGHRRRRLPSQGLLFERHERQQWHRKPLPRDSGSGP